MHVEADSSIAAVGGAAAVEVDCCSNHSQLLVDDEASHDVADSPHFQRPVTMKVVVVVDTPVVADYTAVGPVVDNVVAAVAGADSVDHHIRACSVSRPAG